MKSGLGIWLSGKWVIALFFAASVGCASSGMKINPAFRVVLRQPGSGTKATLASYFADDRPRSSVQHGTFTGKMAPDGTLVGQFVPNEPQVETLDEKCIAVIEQVLLSGRDLPYVARASLGLSGPGPASSDKAKTSEQYVALKEKGISALIRAQLFFRIGVGWNKPLILAMKWEVHSPEGQLLIEAETEEESPPTADVFPDISDPKNAPVLVELARRSAMDFLTELGVTLDSQRGSG